MPRLFFNLIIFFSIFLFPWWISAFLVLVGLFLFVEYYEFLFIMIGIYGLYMTKGVWLISSPFIYSVAVSIIFLGIQSLRRYIILYKNEIPY
jgi:hypothetical protein